MYLGKHIMMVMMFGFLVFLIDLLPFLLLFSSLLFSSLLTDQASKA